jgi:predicted Zn finger-like uncharacterized protein
MKFVCGKCSTKYSLSDERVAGRVVKIRCKSCGNIIEVSGPGAPAAAGAAPDAQAGADPGLADRFARSWKPQAGKEGGGTPGLLQSVQRSAARIEQDETRIANWFVAVDGTPAGPVAAVGIHRYRQAGKVNDGSLVWKEGLPDWIPLRNSKELVGLLARLEIAAGETGQEPAPAVATAPQPRGGPLAGAKAAAAVSPLRGQHLGRLDEEPAAPSPPPPTSAPAVLEDLGADLFPPASAAGPAGPATAEREFFDGLPGPAAGEDSRLASLQQIKPPMVGGQNRLITMAAVGFLGIAIAVLAVALTTGRDPETRTITEVVERVVEKEKIVYRESSPSRGEEPREPVDGEGDKGAAARPKSGQGSGSRVKDREAETADEKKKKLLEQMGLSASSGDQKLVGGGDKSSAADKGSASSALTGDQIRKTYNSNRNSMQLCYERSLKQGEVPEDKSVKADTRIVVGGSGMVKSATVTGQAAAYPGLKSCIEKAVRKWVFPASSGDSPVEIPTLFTPK